MVEIARREKHKCNIFQNKWSKSKYSLGHKKYYYFSTVSFLCSMFRFSWWYLRNILTFSCIAKKNTTRVNFKRDVIVMTVTRSSSTRAQCVAITDRHITFYSKTFGTHILKNIEILWKKNSNKDVVVQKYITFKHESMAGNFVLNFEGPTHNTTYFGRLTFVLNDHLNERCEL